jgi:hypothetical protein
MAPVGYKDDLTQIAQGNWRLGLENVEPYREKPSKSARDYNEGHKIMDKEKQLIGHQ